MRSETETCVSSALARERFSMPEATAGQRPRVTYPLRF